MTHNRTGEADLKGIAPMYIGATTNEDRLPFACDDARLWAHVGPGDDGEPVLTIMCEGED